MELFRKCIAKMKFSYNPEDFKNPGIQKMWTEIEAVALDREKPEEFVDLTLPDPERIEKRAGESLRQIVENLDLPNVSSGGAKRKNNGASTAATKRTKPAATDENDDGSGVDLERKAKEGSLAKLTVPLLKEGMKSIGIAAKFGSKKDDLIKAINEHFEC